MHTFKKDWKGMHTWKYETYEVREISFDYDLHQFEVVKFPGTPKEEVAAVITPDDIEMMGAIIEDLNAGFGVNGWEDGDGNTIAI